NGGYRLRPCNGCQFQMPTTVTELENFSHCGAIHQASLRTTSFARLTVYLLGPCTAWPEAVASVIVVAGRKTSGRNVSTDFGKIEMKTQIGRLMAAVVKSEHR